MLRGTLKIIFLRRQADNFLNSTHEKNNIAANTAASGHAYTRPARTLNGLPGKSDFHGLALAQQPRLLHRFHQ